MESEKHKENGHFVTEQQIQERQIEPHGLRNREFPVVGIGGSAGALQAFSEFLSSIPAGSGAAFVLVQHLEPTTRSVLPELLQRHTAMPVMRVKDGMAVEPGHVYVIPENAEMALFNGRLLLMKPSRPRGLRMPIDTFFQSLAADWGEKAVAIVFSGMGTDGELGARFIKQGLGLVIAQRLDTAQYDSMPRTLIEGGIADWIEAPDQMAGKLFQYLKQPYQNLHKKTAFPTPKAVNTLQKILLMLRTRTGHDFSLYKKNTLFRRLERRMHLHQMANLEEYMTFLQENPQEVQVLLKEFLIGVTRFFRDYPAFQLLEEKLLPQLMGKKLRNEPLRIWIAGCSTGEEAYSIAILAREYQERNKAKYQQKVQIFATDMDKEAIEKARKGLYYSNMGVDMSAERLERWFSRGENHYQINQEIREMVVFAEHNMTRDPAFTKLDLLCCRNVFIYFAPELQKKLLPVFHYTLNPGGILFLGPSENINGLEGSFETLDLKWKFYQRKDTLPTLPHVIEFPGHSLPKPAALPAVMLPGEEKKQLNPEDSVRSILLEHYTPPAVLIDGHGEILYVNGHTSRYLELRPGNVQLNLFAMARPGLAFELRNAVQEALDGQKTVVLPNVQVKSDRDTLSLRLTAKYLTAPEDVKGLLLVFFEELPPAPRRKRLPPAVAGSAPQTQEQEQQVRKLRDQLQMVREEKDVSVEEIRSANEELQSTNEELQSINEEAISAREELQSLNEELMTVNLELREKTNRTGSGQQRHEQPAEQLGDSHRVSGQSSPDQALYAGSYAGV